MTVEETDWKTELRTAFEDWWQNEMLAEQAQTPIDIARASWIAAARWVAHHALELDRQDHA